MSFGGMGGVGRRLVEQALDAGHEVNASVRSPKALQRRAELRMIWGRIQERS